METDLCVHLCSEMEGTVFTPALEGMKHVKSESGEMLTQPFLEVCKQLLPVIGEFQLLPAGQEMALPTIFC